MGTTQTLLWMGSWLGVAMGGVALADPISPTAVPEEAAEQLEEGLRVKMLDIEGRPSVVRPTRRVKPHMPKSSVFLVLDALRCEFEVFIEPSGVPYKVEPSGCPAAIFGEAEEAALKWRFEFSGMEPQRVHFPLAFKFMGDGDIPESKELQQWMSAYSATLPSTAEHQCHVALGGAADSPPELGATTDAAKCFALPFSGPEAYAEVVDLLGSGCSATLSAEAGEAKSLSVAGCDKKSAKRLRRLLEHWHWASDREGSRTYQVTSR